MPGLLRTHGNAATVVVLAILCLWAAVVAGATPGHTHHGPDSAACVLCHSAAQPALVPGSTLVTALLCPLAFPIVSPELGLPPEPAVCKSNPRAPPA